MDSVTIAVRVVRPFRETRTPCPPAGTVGELYDFDGALACVRFPLPMTDANGDEWLTHGEDTDYMRLKFTLDEIEPIPENAE